jgi:16S rRNA (guanine966-N2)-methyltransferase
VRVIAGSARGRPLRAPASGVRPTSDKIKGVVFSMLEAEAYRRGCAPEPEGDQGFGRLAAAVCWPRVLELYAGSGALAIEALSRGASHADLVESRAAARRAIEENLRRTELADRATIYANRADASLSTLPGPYDLILLDPPYDEPGVSTLLEHLADRRLAGRSAVLVWEHRKETVPPEQIGGREASGDDGSFGVWRRRKTNAHGSAAVSLYVSGDGA